MNDFAPTSPPLRPQTPDSTQIQVRPTPTGGELNREFAPQFAQTPICNTCEEYLQRRRTTLLPHLGRYVTRTGKPPSRLVKALTNRHHQEHCQ